MSCQNAQGFLEKNAIKVAEQTDARKASKGRDEALALARSVQKIVAAKGKKQIVLDPNDDDNTLAAHLLGPTGNLRAPTIRTGKLLLVGFSEQAYQVILGN